MSVAVEGMEGGREAEEAEERFTERESGANDPGARGGREVWMRWQSASPGSQWDGHGWLG